MMLVVHGHGRGKGLGTWFVVKPCVLCVMILQNVVPRHAVQHARTETKEMAYKPNENITINTKITNFTPYIAGLGP